MRLTNYALRHHRFMLALVAMMVLMGAVSFVTMPRSEDPQLTMAAGLVVAVYPGGSPQDVEEAVVQPLEEAINELEQVVEIATVIEPGVALLEVSFEAGSDAQDKHAQLVRAVEGTRAQLPAQLAHLEVMRYSPTGVNVLQVAVCSPTASYPQLLAVAEGLKRELTVVSGVAKVEIHGSAQPQVNVLADPQKLQVQGVGFEQLVATIQGSALRAPGGYVESGARRYTVQGAGVYSSLEDIAATPLGVGQGRTLRLDALARVESALLDTISRTRCDGRAALFVTVQQKPGTNLPTLDKHMDAVVQRYAAGVEKSIVVKSIFSQAAGVRSRLRGFFGNLAQGMVIVGAIVLLCMGVRSALVVVMVIPVALLAALGWLDWAGEGLHQISIVGFVVALGLFVDNAIVVTEAIGRLLGQGVSRFEAARLGTAQVGWAIVSSTATTIAAFIPMLLLNSDTGHFIRGLPLSVILSLSASLVLSLTFTPYCAALLLRPSSARGAQGAWGARKSALQALVRRLLGVVVVHPWRIVAAAVALFGVSLLLVPQVGVSLFPKAEKPMVLVNLEAPAGASLGETDRLARQVEAVCMQLPAVGHVATTVGKGNPRIYYNMMSQRESSSMAQLLVLLTDDAHALRERTVAQLRELLDTIAGARIEVREFLQGEALEAPVAIRVVGSDADALGAVGAQIKQALMQVPGAVNVKVSGEQKCIAMRLAINTTHAAALGLTPLDIQQQVRAATAGVIVGTFRPPGGEEVDLVLYLRERLDRRIDIIDALTITTRSGALVPLSRVAAVRFEPGQSRIDHHNLRRSVMVSADVASGTTADAVTRAVRLRSGALQLPPGVRLEFAGEQESRDSSFGGMGRALLAACAAIAAILILQFGSYSQPLIVAAALPFAVSGALVGLWVTGMTFSFTAFIGLTGLLGIVVNNSILLVDSANQLRSQGMEVAEAIVEATRIRLTPVMVTSLTTIGGLVPLGFSGSSLWVPMAAVLIGGLSLSTIVVVAVVPALYVLATPKTRRS
jgi:multidrug efflux pump subunit AcrB